MNRAIFHARNRTITRDQSEPRKQLTSSSPPTLSDLLQMQSPEGGWVSIRAVQLHNMMVLLLFVRTAEFAQPPQPPLATLDV